MTAQNTKCMVRKSFPYLIERLFIPPKDQILALVALVFIYAGTCGALQLFWRSFPNAAIQMITPLLIIRAVIIGASIWFSWRLANEDQGGGGAFVIKLSCLAVTLASLALLMKQWAQAARAPLKPSSGPPLLVLNNNAAQLDGPNNFKCFAGLENTLKAYPDLKMHVLNSPSGRIPAAKGLVSLIGEAKLATHMDTLCASASKLAFIAGQSRTLYGSAQLGFHGYKLNSNTATN